MTNWKPWPPRLAAGLTQVFAQAQIPATLNRVGSMLTGFFNPGPVQTLAQVEQSDTAAYGRYFHALLTRGVYIAPSQFEAGFVSLGHTEGDIDRTGGGRGGCSGGNGVGEAAEPYPPFPGRMRSIWGNSGRKLGLSFVKGLLRELGKYNRLVPGAALGIY